MTGDSTALPGERTIVLIAGSSSSGKTTVARAVAQNLGLQVLSLDDYFLSTPRLYVEHGGGKVRSFERPQLYDGASLAAEVLRTPRGAVVEGFCLFSYPEVYSLSSLRFFIDVPFEVCRQRRMARQSRPSDKSFLLIGEAEDAAFVRPQRTLPGVEQIAGEAPPDRVAAAVLGHIKRAGVSAAI